MSRSRRITTLAASVLVALGVATAAADPPKRRVRAALERELEVLDRAVDLRRGVEALERERESVAWAQRHLDHRSRESLRRLDVYRAERVGHEDQTRARARVMYKLARGGLLRLAQPGAGAEHDADREEAARRVARARAIRWLVRADLRNLAVHRKAESRAESELLATSRELGTLSSLTMVQELQREVLAAADDRLEPEVRAAMTQRRRLVESGQLGRTEASLLARVQRRRADLWRGRGLDLVEARSLHRPVPGAVVGVFGDYVDPVLRLPAHRNGLELRARPHDEVEAIAAGKVAMVGELPGYEQVVILDHGGGYLSLTGRLTGVTVAEGDEVEAGQVLGHTAPKVLDDGLGRTVYLEIRHGERPIDPGPALAPVGRGSS